MLIEAHFGKFGASLGDAGTGAKNVGDELVGSDVVFAFDFVEIDGVASETEAGDTKALIVDGVVVEWVVVSTGIGYDIGDTDDSVMLGERGKSLEVERELVRCDSDSLVVGIIKVEIATKIGVFSLIDYGSAHNSCSLLVIVWGWFVNSTNEPDGARVFVADEEEVGIVKGEVDFLDGDVEIVVEGATTGTFTADKGGGGGGFDAVIAEIYSSFVDGVADVETV